AFEGCAAKYGAAQNAARGWLDARFFRDDRSVGLSDRRPAFRVALSQDSGGGRVGVVRRRYARDVGVLLRALRSTLARAVPQRLDPGLARLEVIFSLCL